VTTLEHCPDRPSWGCRACGEPWPCERARKNLADDPTVVVYMSLQLALASRGQLAVRLNDAVSPPPAQRLARCIAIATDPDVRGLASRHRQREERRYPAWWSWMLPALVAEHRQPVEHPPARTQLPQTSPRNKDEDKDSAARRDTVPAWLTPG
jgi:hypothetical protein